MKYEELKDEIKAIAAIADSVPEVFKERCFELLLQNLLVSVPAGEKSARQSAAKIEDSEEKLSNIPPAGNNGTIPTPSQIKVFMQKTGTTAPEIAKILIYEDNTVLFIQEPSGNKIARGQVEWALLLALKKGIEKNILEVDPEDVRSICQEKGFYDPKNFSGNFKWAATAKFFQGAMEKQGTAQKLSADGVAELGKIVKEFAARATS